MPVYNGENFLAQAIDSLLAQTYTDFELLISDNASTDKTAEICLSRAARDSRIRYSRTETTIGPAENHNRLVPMALGEYFRWAAHDDLCAPELLEREVEVLDRDPSVVLVHPKVQIIDDNGDPLEVYDQNLATSSDDPARRFWALVGVNHRKHGAFEIFGLMRISALRKTPLEGNYARGDSVLLARMSLLGRFHEIPERLFLNRQHGSRSVQQVPTYIKSGRSRLAKWLGTGPVPPPEWWDASKKGAIVFPEWKSLLEYYKSIWMAPITGYQRAKCLGYLGKWLLKYWPKLSRDVIFAAERIALGPLTTDRLALNENGRANA
jgi:glycosyltransferase involved in cell wall biosynthesis